MNSNRTFRPAARTLSILLAAGLALASAPAGRYDVGTETVLDRGTGLTWQRATAPGTYTWDQAKTYCAGIALGTPSTGWRLPTVRELSTLVASKVSQPAIDTAAFPSTPAARFWTSTAYVPAASSAWTVFFSDGGVLHAGATEPHNVRCVR